jgi:hypothetical protein
MRGTVRRIFSTAGLIAGLPPLSASGENVSRASGVGKESRLN